MGAGAGAPGRLVKSAGCCGHQELQEAVETCVKAQKETKAAENSLIRTFAISKVGRSYVKDSGGVAKESIKDTIAYEELQRFRETADGLLEKLMEMPKEQVENRLKHVNSNLDLFLSIRGKLPDKKAPKHTEELKAIGLEIEKGIVNSIAVAIDNLANSAKDPERRNEKSRDQIIPPLHPPPSTPPAP